MAWSLPKWRRREASIQAELPRDWLRSPDKTQRLARQAFSRADNIGALRGTMSARYSGKDVELPTDRVDG